VVGFGVGRRVGRGSIGLGKAGRVGRGWKGLGHKPGSVALGLLCCGRGVAMGEGVWVGGKRLGTHWTLLLSTDVPWVKVRGGNGTGERRKGLGIQ
jgi:hypothetical protein